MWYKKRYFSCSGNSILESVIALSVISVCLFIAILVYTNVFSVRTSPKFYHSRNQNDALFFLMQLEVDSIVNDGEEWGVIEEEWLNTQLKKVTVNRKDSIKGIQANVYYIQRNE